MTSQYIKLNTGAEMPLLGLGTWQIPEEEVRQAIDGAFENGYKHIDCAYVYQNEKEIGQAFADTVDHVIKRKDLFVTSKLWVTMMEPDRVKEGIQIALKNLRLEYLDLFLIHWPHSTVFQDHDTILPLNDHNVPIAGPSDYKTTWKAMEQLVDDGLVKAIGLSNFNTKQVDDIMENCNIKPAVNQFETHPYMTCNRWIEHCRQHNIGVTAYCPLGSPSRPDAATSNNPVLLDDPVIQSIGKKYNKSSAQVCLRFNIQRNIIVVPKSVTPTRIAENSKVFQWRLRLQRMRYYRINGNNLFECIMLPFVKNRGHYLIHT